LMRGGLTLLAMSSDIRMSFSGRASNRTLHECWQRIGTPNQLHHTTDGQRIAIAKTF